MHRLSDDEPRVRGAGASTPGAQVPPGSRDDLAALLARTRESLLGPGEDLGALSDEERLEILHQIELLGRAAAGLGVRVQTAFRASQVRAQLADGVRPSRVGLAVGDDLALVRLTSPYWGRRELTSARALVEQMPRTLTALEEGTISAYQARQITELTTCLSAEDRAEVDARLDGVLPGIASGELARTVRALVYEIDPQGFVARARKAAADRGVSLRAAPDVMGILTARLAAPQAIAVYQCLQAAARVKKASGDPRTFNQLMADELYERLTGRLVVDGVDVEVGLVITDTALFAGTSDPADLLGYGPIPAELARELLRRPADSAAQPGSGPAADHGHADDQGHADDHGLADDHGPSADQVHAADAAPAPTEADRSVQQARADARANVAGFAGGRVPAGHCPDGPRCTVFSCALVHGAAGSASAGAPADGPAAVAPQPTGANSDTTGVNSDTTNVHAARVWIRRLFTDPVTGCLPSATRADASSPVR